MFDKTRKWVKKHPVITGFIIAGSAIAVAVYCIFHKQSDDESGIPEAPISIASIPKDIVDTAIAPISQDDISDEEMSPDDLDYDASSWRTDTDSYEDEDDVTADDGEIIFSSRIGFIRNYKNRTHSEAKALQALELGIKLLPNQTIVDPTTVKRHAS